MVEVVVTEVVEAAVTEVVEAVAVATLAHPVLGQPQPRSRYAPTITALILVGR